MAELLRELQVAAGQIADQSREASRRHYLRGRAWRRVSIALGAPAIVIALSAAVAATIGIRPRVTAVLAILGVVIMAMRVVLRPDQRAKRDEARSREYIDVGADAIDFAEIDLSSPVGIEALIGRRDGLRQRLRSLGGDD